MERLRDVGELRLALPLTGAACNPKRGASPGPQVGGRCAKMHPGRRPEIDVGARQNPGYRPTRRKYKLEKQRRGCYSVRDGMKRCRGTICQGAWRPVTEFSRLKRGRSAGYYQSRCRQCQCAANAKYQRDYHGYIKATRVRWVFEEMYWRVGTSEAARRAGICPSTMRKILRGKTQYVEKRTFFLVAKTLRELREQNVVRHKDSIHVGAAMRGWREKPVRSAADIQRAYRGRMTERVT